MQAILELCSLPPITLSSTPIFKSNDKIHLVKDQDYGEVRVSMQNHKYFMNTAVVLN